jgi:hypothetical protein
MYTGIAHTPNGPLSTEFAHRIAGGDLHFGVPPREVRLARESLRTTTYSLQAVLTRAQEKPEVRDWARSRTADLEAVTAAELSARARIPRS